jgi:pimeloyl-ACP methyl ester carboxylesterase
MTHCSVVIGSEANRELQSLEYAWIGDPESTTTLVFLHEGLGSLSAWGGFPERLCQSLRVRGLLYSRSGYGLSVTDRPKTGLAVDYHDQEALQSLPGLLDALGIQSCYLFGHSDGATIALLAAASANAARYRGLILLAPHIFVEAVTVAGVREARQAYEQGSLKGRISRHHLDVDAVFYGWNDLWLSAEFQDWNIEGRLSAIRCPVMVIQGASDEYATYAQLGGIAAQIKSALIMEVPDCGHFPQRDAESLVIDATKALMGG